MYFQCGTRHYEDIIGRWDDKDYVDDDASYDKLKHLRRYLQAFPYMDIDSRPADLYDSLQERYQRQLSYNTDIGKAFLGFFHAFQDLDSRKATHFYGVPVFSSSASFVTGLMWKAVRDELRKEPSSIYQQFSSWMWAPNKSKPPPNQARELVFSFG
jgi:hypothetical protein